MQNKFYCFLVTSIKDNRNKETELKVQISTGFQDSDLYICTVYSIGLTIMIKVRLVRKLKKVLPHLFLTEWGKQT